MIEQKFNFFIFHFFVGSDQCQKRRPNGRKIKNSWFLVIFHLKMVQTGVKWSNLACFAFSSCFIRGLHYFSPKMKNQNFSSILAVFWQFWVWNGQFLTKSKNLFKYQNFPVLSTYNLKIKGLEAQQRPFMNFQNRQLFFYTLYNNVYYRT